MNRFDYENKVRIRKTDKEEIVEKLDSVHDSETGNDYLVYTKNERNYFGWVIYYKRIQRIEDGCFNVSDLMDQCERNRVAQKIRQKIMTLREQVENDG